MDLDLYRSEFEIANLAMTTDLISAEIMNVGLP